MEPAPLCFAGSVGAIFRKFVFRERLGSGNQLTRHDTLSAARTSAVLDARDLARMPAVEKVAEDAAVPAKLTVVVGGAFPDAHGGEVRWLQGADLPLVHCVIGNAVDTDFAVAPALRARPLDALVEILRLAHRPHIETAGGTTGAARVDTYTCISFRHPFLRIN